MLKEFLPKIVKALMVIAFIVICGSAFAHGGSDGVDSTAVLPVNATTPVTILGFVVPGWLETLGLAFITVLPGIQLILKRIPTDYSVRIQGLIGFILDILTFFQKDRKSNGGVHK